MNAEQIRLAAKLYEMRDTARRHYGDRWQQCEVPENASDGTWVATTKFCNDQVTASQVRVLRRVLDAARRELSSANTVHAETVSESPDPRDPIRGNR